MRYTNSDFSQLSSISHCLYRAAIILVFINDPGVGLGSALHVLECGAMNRKGLEDKLQQAWEQMTLSYMETKRNINIAW